MPCDVISMPGGGHAIIRRSARPRCAFCGTREHTKLCDHSDPTRISRTCDARMCDLCATRIGSNLDVCPDHKLNSGIRNPESQGVLPL